jgi:hypothetical protein
MLLLLIPLSANGQNLSCSPVSEKLGLPPKKDLTTYMDKLKSAK